MVMDGYWMLCMVMDDYWQLLMVIDGYLLLSMIMEGYYLLFMVNPNPNLIYSYRCLSLVMYGFLNVIHSYWLLVMDSYHLWPAMRKSTTRKFSWNSRFIYESTQNFLLSSMVKESSSNSVH